MFFVETKQGRDAHATRQVPAVVRAKRLGLQSLGMIERLTKLEQMLQRTPGDPFLLYGIALEHKKAGDAARAIEFLDRTIAADAGYCYAYFQKGQVQESLGDAAAARATYEAGVAAARRKGDAHAQSEIEGALSMLG
jgi:tetratricopeptide (TPR) repeat protein